MIAIDTATTEEPIAVWYKTNSWRWEVEPIKVLKISAKQLVIISPYNGIPRTTAKVSTNTSYWQTQDEALNYLRERIQRLRVQLASAETKFAATEAAAREPR